MEMEVMMSMPPPMDFNFDSNCSSPYITAPSSPQRFGNFFFSAPTSPTHNVSSFFHHQLNNNDDNHFHARHSSASKPSKDNNYNEDFEFDFSGNLERPSLSAEELFHGGKIRPLKVAANNESSTKKNIQAAFNKKDSIEGTRKRVEDEEEVKEESQQRHKRGKESRRSMSSLNFPDSYRHCGNVNVCCDSDDVSHKGGVVSISSVSTDNKKATTSSFSSFLSSISFTKGYRKWRFKDFLLFRSASEGRATNKDHLRKYVVLSKTTPHEDVSNSSFRSTERSGSVSRRRGPVSAHELHYTVNRAASEELKKKTLLPYKQGLLGCLGFNPGVHHISRRIGSLERS